jgi:hypothetical protein
MLEDGCGCQTTSGIRGTSGTSGISGTCGRVLREHQGRQLRILFGKTDRITDSQNFNKINLGSSILSLYLYSKLKHYEQRKGIESSKRSNG